MKAVKDIYRMGKGPSSSHTIGPYRIASLFKENHEDCDRYEVDLSGSLALTGEAHGTLKIVREVFGEDKVSFNLDKKTGENLMTVTGYKNGEITDVWHGISVGGGEIRIREFPTDDDKEIYEENSLNEIKKHLESKGISLCEYIYSHESSLKDYLYEVLQKMSEEVKRGLEGEGCINQRLNYYRNAKKLYEASDDDRSRLTAYSYAASEENAAGNSVVTAPTLGSCGIMASLMYYLKNDKKADRDKLVDALAVGGLFGNIVRENASISGAVGGCQAEVGTACAMAAAAYAHYLGYSLETVEYAAEIGIEHNLGLTCDPVLGYVIIPCIERNAVGVLRAMDACNLAHSLISIGKRNLVSFDSVVETMKYTGKKLAVELKET